MKFSQRSFGSGANDRCHLKKRNVHIAMAVIPIAWLAWIGSPAPSIYVPRGA